MDLNNIDEINKLDSQNMRSSIVELPNQIKQTLEEIEQLHIPEEYTRINKIVFCGMGGSALGAHFVKHLYGLDLKYPFEIISDYNLPAYVGESTLVIAQSYSGTTEEVLSCYDQAQQKGAQIVTISAGGTLKEKALANNGIHFTIDPKFNPSNQPRMAIGYAIFADIGILHALDLIGVSEEELQDIYEQLNIINENNRPEVLQDSNEAKKSAMSLHKHFPIFVAGEHMLGAVHTTRNQMNENAKSLAIYFPLPDLNHHVLEAFPFPTELKSVDYYVFVDSDLYSPKVSKRLEITNEIVRNNGHSSTVYKAPGKTKIGQMLATIHYGSYVGFYLAMLNEIDPSPIENVESFKKKL